MTPYYEERSVSLFIGPVCDHPFSSHVHDVVEIVYLNKGQLTMTISGKQDTLTAGDVATVFPSVPHSYDDVSQDAEGLALIFPLDTLHEYIRVFRTMRPTEPFFKAHLPDVTDAAERLATVANKKQTHLQTAYLHVFLAHLLNALPMRTLGKYMETGLTHQVLGYIAENFSTPLTLDSTAHALGISRSHLSHIFSQQLHINFRQYINKLRIDRACFLLCDPQFSITQVAYMCGYENPRTFHRAFQNERGMQPSQYRASGSEK